MITENSEINQVRTRIQQSFPEGHGPGNAGECEDPLASEKERAVSLLLEHNLVRNMSALEEWLS
jgi:hypothetical protein